MVLSTLPGMCLLFLLARRRSDLWAASVLLLGSFILAAIGVMMKLSFSLMLVGCLTALASWDLMQFAQIMNRSENRENIALLEKHHHRSLAIALAGGSLLSLAAANLALELPFIVTLVLCAVALGGVYFGVRVFIRNDL
jgi:hypothetical protein